MMKKVTIQIAAAIILIAAMLLLRAELVTINKQKALLLQKLTTFIQQNRIVGLSSFEGKEFKNFELADISGKPWRLGDDSSTLKVLILFGVQDCATCLLESPLWNMIHKKFSDKNVLVLGICHSKSIDDMLDFVAQRQLDFPVLHDPQETVRRSLGIKPSPLRILLDKKNKILDIVRSDPEISKQKHALKMIRRQLNAGG